jgi:hypothetical protein
MTERKKPDGLALLREPFPAHQISKLPKPLKKRDEMDRLPKAKCAVCGGYHATSSIIHLDYVGHAALTDRLLDADPTWTWEPLKFGADGLPLFDATGGLWIRLTVCGVTRLGYGNAESKSYQDVGAREKEVIGDALRNAAMRFGAALDLWHKGQLHIDDETDRSEQAVPAPSGYDDWRESLEAVAVEGTPALQAMWKQSPRALRDHLTKTDADWWESLKKKAEEAADV